MYSDAATQTTATTESETTMQAENEPEMSRQSHAPEQDVKVKAEDVSLWYGQTQALYNVNLDIHARKVTALIGPSGCGKSSFCAASTG